MPENAAPPPDQPSGNLDVAGIADSRTGQATGESPAPGGEPSKKIIGILSVLTAAMTLSSAVLGVVSVGLHRDKQAAEAQVITLSTDVSVLTEQVITLEVSRDELAVEAEQARQERDQLQQDLDRVTAEEGRDPISDPVARTRTYLSDERMLAASLFQSGTASVSGDVYLHSVMARQGLCSGEAKQSFAEYNLGRAYERFTANAGLSDTNRRASHRVRFEVIVDGQQIFDVTLTAGQVAQVDEPITGGLRLRLQVTFFADGECSNRDDFDQAVFGDAALVPPAGAP